MRRKKRRWFESFETGDAYQEDATIKNKTLHFLRNFKYQDGRYKFVWIIRIGLWILLGALAAYGIAVKIIQMLTGA